MVSVVDWKLAARTAKALSPAPPEVTAEEAEQAVAQLRASAERAAEHVAALTGLQEPAVSAVTRVVDRPGWIDVNAVGLHAVIAPLADRLIGDNPPGKLAAALGARATGAQAGALLSFMSTKVLGQFEFFARPDGQLLLVAPNIVSVERSLSVDPADFRLWVCLHEVTHRVQFTAVPWMRSYLLGEVQRLTESLDTDPDALRARFKDIVAAVRERRGDPGKGGGGLLDVLATGPQKEILDGLTGFMSLVEGHAEYVMNAVSADIIPSQRVIERRFGARRRRGANPLDRLLRMAMGLDAKARQYIEGAQFVRTVIDRVGLENFNAVWSGPEALPSKAEIADPGAWIGRVHR
jgi:coenzyme F420 biosynthesis associated uncharacterized protein